MEKRAAATTAAEVLIDSMAKSFLVRANEYSKREIEAWKTMYEALSALYYTKH
jgi:hypothetical protein